MKKWRNEMKKWKTANGKMKDMYTTKVIYQIWNDEMTTTNSKMKDIWRKSDINEEMKKWNEERKNGQRKDERYVYDESHISDMKWWNENSQQQDERYMTKFVFQWTNEEIKWRKEKRPTVRWKICIRWKPYIRYEMMKWK